MKHSFPTRRSSDRRKSHERVGGATVFGAGAAIAAGLGRLQHQARGAAGDHVHLAAQRRNPERVNHIGAVEQQLGAAPGRQADLVGAAIERASCRERVCRYVLISVVGGTLQQKTSITTSDYMKTY